MLTRPGGTRRRSTVRFRVTALAAAAVAVVLTASAVGLVFTQRSQLLGNLDNSLEQRADQLTEALASGGPSAVVANSNAEDRGAQLVGSDGTVLAATHNLDGEGPVASLPPGADQLIRTDSTFPIEDDFYRVLSRRLDTPDGSAILHVAENIDDLTDTIRALTTALAVTVPLVVGIMTGLVWALVGRTLRPVEEIRAEVTAITGTDNSRRVRVPPHDDEIGRLATTMNDMLDRVAEAHGRQRRFIADASHELRSPLTRIRTELEVDLTQPATADLRSTHETVLDETIELQRLVNDLLFLARADADVTPLRPEPLDLDDIVLREARRARQDGRVAIDNREVSGAHVRGDRDQLTRVVRNLLDNAVRHARTTVTVGLNETPSGVVLSVADDGSGIPTEAQESIFERFARVDDSRARHDGGTGLGLAISREIVERHGGTVVVDPDWTKGARFVVTLPG